MDRLHLFILKNITKFPKLKKNIKKLKEEKDNNLSRLTYDKLKVMANDILEMANIKPVILGTENLPKETCVIYANHQSLLDPILLLLLNKELGFIVKKELKDNKIVNDLVQITDSLYLDREDTKEGLKTILEAIKNIKDGKSYCIFPEGTRANSNILSFKAGSFKLSTKTNTPICPVAIIGAREAINTNNMNLIQVKIEILPPIYPHEYRNMNTTQIAEMVEKKIEEKIAEYT